MKRIMKYKRWNSLYVKKIDKISFLNFLKAHNKKKTFTRSEVWRIAVEIFAQRFKEIFSKSFPPPRVREISSRGRKRKKEKP